MSDCNEKPNLQFAFTGPTGPYTPPDFCKGTLDYSTSECADNDSNYVAGLMAEALNIAAGPVNVFPLLGVYSQGSTADQVGEGYPLSSGTLGGYNVADGFNVNAGSWRSVQTGAAVLTTPAYIGYNFGTKKAWTAIGPAQERYQPGSPLRKRVATLMIKQGAVQVNRAIQARIEASDDGVTWHRVDVVNLPDTANLETVSVKANAMFSQWRIIPIFFNGVAANEAWEVVELQLLESTQVSLDNVEDFLLLENRDRNYSRTSILIKCQYDLLDVQTELAKFGINLPQTYIFTCSFADMVKSVSRPIVVGDIIELPGEVQYDHNLKPVRKWLEVTDTAWATEGYTMNWKPQLFKFYAQPILPSIEHKDILGVPGQVNGFQTDADVLANGYIQDNLTHLASEAIQQEAADAVPQTGGDPQDIMSGKSLLGPDGTYDGRDLYVEDAIPPDGAAYTIGDTLPDYTEISDGHYHRQTYTSVAANIRPADRLLQYNAAKGRWRIVEVNRRRAPESHKPTMSEILGSQTQFAPDDKP